MHEGRPVIDEMNVLLNMVWSSKEGSKHEILFSRQFNSCDQ